MPEFRASFCPRKWEARVQPQYWQGCNRGQGFEDFLAEKSGELRANTGGQNKSTQFQKRNFKFENLKLGFFLNKNLNLNIILQKKQQHDPPPPGGRSIAVRSPQRGCGQPGGGGGAAGPLDGGGLPWAIVTIAFLSMRILNTVARVHLDGLQSMVATTLKVRPAPPPG